MISAITGFKVYGLADPIYAMVKAGFGIDGKAIDWSSREKKNAPIEWLSDDEHTITLRWLLETLGTEWGRNQILDDLWLRLADKFIRESPTGVIIKDIRFPNEQSWLDRIGGKLVYIMRPTYTNGDATKGHASNIPLEIRQQDIVLMNDGSLEQLNEKVTTMCMMNNWEYNNA